MLRCTRHGFGRLSLTEQALGVEVRDLLLIVHVDGHLIKVLPSGFHSAPHVDRWNRVQLVDQEGCRIASTRRSQSSRNTAGKVVPAGTVAVVRSFDSLRASERATALSTLIRQRRLTPSCGGHAPTAERTVGPARMTVESLTPRPGIREQYRPLASFRDRRLLQCERLIRSRPLIALGGALRRSWLLTATGALERLRARIPSTPIHRAAEFQLQSP